MLVRYLVEHYGDVASIVGLLVSLFGFLATISNVRRARRAAEEAQAAAREAVLRIQSHVLTSDIFSSLQHVRSIDAACGKRSWDEAVADCDEARTLLAKLLDHQVFDKEAKDFIRSAVENLGLLLPYIEKIRDSEKYKDKEVSPQKRRQLHQIIMFLSRIHGRLESQAFEVE